GEVRVAARPARAQLGLPRARPLGEPRGDRRDPRRQRAVRLLPRRELAGQLAVPAVRRGGRAAGSLLALDHDEQRALLALDHEQHLVARRAELVLGIECALHGLAIDLLDHVADLEPRAFAGPARIDVRDLRPALAVGDVEAERRGALIVGGRALLAALGLRFRLLELRHLDRLLQVLAVAHHLELDLRAGRSRSYRARQLAHPLDLLVAEAQDHVAALDPGLARGALRRDRGDQSSLLRLEVECVGELGGHGLHADAEPPAHHLLAL